jgi:hypothetical protein
MPTGAADVFRFATLGSCSFIASASQVAAAGEPGFGVRRKKQWPAPDSPFFVRMSRSTLCCPLDLGFVCPIGLLVKTSKPGMPDQVRRDSQRKNPSGPGTELKEPIS